MELRPGLRATLDALFKAGPPRHAIVPAAPGLTGDQQSVSCEKASAVEVSTALIDTVASLNATLPAGAVIPNAERGR